jgi:hypothetical protein
MRKPAAFGLATCLALGLSGASLADDLKAAEKFSESTVAFDLPGPYSNVTLTVAGPNRFHASASAKSGTPTIDLRRAGAPADGQYSYQLTAATEEKTQVRSALDNGRGPGAQAAPLKSVAASGTFHVQNGAIVKRDPDAREPQQKRK